MKHKKRRLMWHGMLLFLLGLITGLVEQRFTNVRMGLSAHLEGVMNGIPPPCARCRMERGTAASSGKGDGLLHCTLRHLCELASDLDSCGFRDRSKFSNHFSRPQRSAMARELCRNGISHSDDRNDRYVDTRSLGSSRNGRRGQR